MEVSRSRLYLLLLAVALGTFLASVALHTLRPDLRWENVVLHSIVEAVGALAAIIMALFLLLREEVEDRWKLLLLGLGFLGMGLFDGFHAATLPGGGFIFLHTAASLVGGFWLALVWLPEPGSYALWKKWAPWIVATAAALCGTLWSVFAAELPRMSHNGQFTGAAVAMNATAGVMFVVASARFLLDFRRSNRLESYLFSCLALLFGLAGFLFKLSTLWETTWWLWHLVRLTAYLLALGFVMVGHRRTVSDLKFALAERKRAEQEMRRLNRALKTLSECNQVMVRAADESELLREICRVLVEDGGYRLAWAGFADDDEAKSVRPVARAGFDEGYVDQLQVTWADTERGRGPTGTAIRTGQPCVARRTSTDPAFGPWRAEATQRGYASAIALPLITNSKPLGALSIYATEPDAFDAEEVRLLTELANDLAYGIAALRARADRALAKEALRQEERYRALVVASAQIVWTTNAQGEVADDIPTWRAFTGQSEQEIKGWGWTEAVHPDDRQSTAALWSRAVETRSLYDTQFRVRRHDGEYRYLAARGVPVLEADGSIREWVGTCTDITERKQAEEARAYLASIVESSDDAIIGKNLEGTILSWNRGAQRLYGYSVKEAEGRSISLLVPPDRRDELPAILDRIKRGECIEHHETVRVCKDGRHIHVALVISPNKDAQGRIVGASSIAHDITELKLNAEQLRRANAYNRSLIEASLDPLVTISPDGKITDVNSATEKVTGFSRKELIGADFSNYFTDPARAGAGYQQVFREGWVQDYELEIRHRDGHITPVVYNASVYRDEAGEVIGVFAAARDITQRKRAEAETHKVNAELTAANRELEAFTYSVSHNLRAPLRHVDGFSKLLLEEYSEGLPEEARHYLTSVRDGTRHMGKMVDDLLKLTRLGRSELSVQLTGLTSLVEEVLRDLKPELEGRQIEWRLGQLPFVECDPALLRQVFANLLANAIKFTRPRERAVIEVGTTMQDGSPVIFIRDNGVGFSMKYADKLFGVFQRLHRPEDFEGTGVGLATVQRIVHKHGGRVWAEAQLNKGATFCFTLGQPERQGMENNSKAGGAV